ncbi:hypothetical protein LUZ63_015418 [Rhynchospora breviuscula]|uniref:Uncharacterized protein n=1 Tax=Rhynchospora breviuscula TaxID=2022672 RepID=A0A9Q0CCA0_9POAL|nr:hypothetical protein LUZ63_015418 [Rhynchospora breviuscula]
MAGLQRSATTFRRSGSSGLVWDERFLAGLNSEEEKNGEHEGEPKPDLPQLRHSRSVGSIDMLKRDIEEGKQVLDAKEKSKTDARKQNFHTAYVSPDMDPPSPKVSGCILCSIFRKPEPKKPVKGHVKRR